MYIYWPGDEILVVKPCWSVNHNKRQKIYFDEVLFSRTSSQFQIFLYPVVT